MCLLTESIRVENRKLCNIKYHQRRFEKARRELLGLNDGLQLSEAIKIPNDISSATYKCRIVYKEKIESVEFTLYDKRLPNTIKLVTDDQIDYTYKYNNRERLKSLVENSNADEIVIVKNGFVTDTSRSNIVLSKGSRFVTPTTFLLEGTMRNFLLEEKIIVEEEVKAENLFEYDYLYLINAMLDLNNQPGFPVSKIERV